MAPTQVDSLAAEQANVPLADRAGRVIKVHSFSSKEAERASLKETLAAGFRIFAKYGFDDGIAGHISVRDPIDPTCFWVNPLGMHFSLIKASDLILVDGSGRVVDGGPNRQLNAAAYMIHHAIHTARPDVNCAAHAHSQYGRAFCALGRTLDMITQDTCQFYNDHVLYDQFRGIVLEKEEGEAIAKTLGDKKVMLLQNHGLLTTGRTVAETVYWFVSLERCCHTQLLADAAAGGRGGETKKIGEKEALESWKTTGSSEAGHYCGQVLMELIDVETRGAYKL